jgi:DNA-directed RNA polymerase I subunit RPA43
MSLSSDNHAILNGRLKGCPSVWTLMSEVESRNTTHCQRYKISLAPVNRQTIETIMAKRSRDETEDERKERKRAKKEARKTKKDQQHLDKMPSSPPASKKLTQSIGDCSCQRQTIRMIFSLYPSDLEDIVREIKRSLRQNLLKYVPGMDGVLLAFDNVRIVPNGGIIAGMILNEQPHIHYLADMDTLIFSPSKDMKLLGTVTECFESHVGFLVHNFFNASISSDQLVAAGFSYDDQGDWVHEDGSTTIAAEEKVKFTVEKVHECAGTISMEGMDPTVIYGDDSISFRLSTNVNSL